MSFIINYFNGPNSFTNNELNQTILNGKPSYSAGNNHPIIAYDTYQLESINAKVILPLFEKLKLLDDDNSNSQIVNSYSASANVPYSYALNEAIKLVDDKFKQSLKDIAAEFEAASNADALIRVTEQNRLSNFVRNHLLVYVPTYAAVGAFTGFVFRALTRRSAGNVALGIFGLAGAVFGYFKERPAANKEKELKLNKVGSTHRIRCLKQIENNEEKLKKEVKKLLKNEIKQLIENIKITSEFIKNHPSTKNSSILSETDSSSTALQDPELKEKCHQFLKYFQELEQIDCVGDYLGISTRFFVESKNGKELLKTFIERVNQQNNG